MSRPKSAPPDLQGFTFERGIGGGGFADVFLYRQHRPNRPVAIKVLRSENLSPANLRQFDEEANRMAEVSAHPYIVTIYGADTAPDGRPYILMEPYPGDHFGIRARGGQLPIAEVLRVGVQVASAVETAHRAGILHRDIKPANILVSAFERPGLTDFGISAVRQDGRFERAAGLSIGYAAPEVVEESDGAGSEQSDVYSLAATLFSMLSGHSPFAITGGDNTQPAMTTRVLSGQRTPLTRPDVPAGLRHLLTQALAAAPDQRPAGALAFARGLQDVEQALQLPPTPLEVRNTAPTRPAIRHQTDEEDEDGTRRSGPRVVVAQPTPAPVPAAPWSAPAKLAPAPLQQGHVAQHSDSDTVMRGVPSTPGNTTAETPTPRRRIAAPLIAGIVLVVAVGAIVALTVLGGGGRATPATTTLAGLPIDPVVIAPPDPPRDIVVSYAPDGALTVAWDADGANDSDQYRIRRTDPDGGGISVTVDNSPATLPADPGTTPCVTVVAVRDGRLSQPEPDPVCATSPAP